MMVYLGADHGGYALKERIKVWVQEWGKTWEDCGNTRIDSEDDYPFYAWAVAQRVARDGQQGKDGMGVLACRSAAGMVIAANKVSGIRAVQAWNIDQAIHAREHNNANILALSGDFLKEEEAKTILKAWFETPFTGASRHTRRLQEIWRFEEKNFEIIPAILEKDFLEAEKKIRLIKSYVSWIHLDVADGVFVPNETFHIPQEFSNFSPVVNLEIHLMVKNPVEMVDPWIEAGARRIIAHIEAEKIDDFLDRIKQKKGVEAGLAIDGPTEIAAVLPYLNRIDELLVMGIKAGFSGQPFEDHILKKITFVRERYPDLFIGVDGGMRPETASLAVAAGASRIVASSYLFQNVKNLKTAIERLKGLRE